MKELEIWKRKIDNCAAAYEQLFEQYEIVVPDKGILAGFPKAVLPLGSIEEFFSADNMHYPLGDAYLKYGVSGILQLTQNQITADTEETAYYRRGIFRVYSGIQRFIQKHAEKAEQMGNRKIAGCCRRLAEGRPESFEDGLQLFWFFYFLRSPFGGGCIGRLDQKLYPFYLKQKQDGTWNDEKAMEAVTEFYGLLNALGTGDTLRNLMLSGQNENGEDETNELTYLFLESYAKTGDAEPHLNVRIHKKTPERLKKLCVSLIAEGKGQPTLYFDEAIMPAMEKAGISHKSASRYANDGCTETLIDGESNIAFWQHEMVKTVELTVFEGKENPYIFPVTVKKNRESAPGFVPHTQLELGFAAGRLAEMKSFEDFWKAFLGQLDFQLDCWRCKINDKIEADEKETLTSLLVGGTFEKCLQTGNDPLRGGGFEVSNYQLLSGTVTTAADCLRGIEYCVFEKRYCTLEQMREALAHNFEGMEGLRIKFLNAPKYGNQEARVDGIAAMIASHFIDRVNGWRSKSGKRIWPGLYNIDFKIFANITGATPDGRKFRDAIGEHCAPTPGAARLGPTAIIKSAAALPMKEGYASSPLHLTLDKNSFCMGADRHKILEKLIEGCYREQIPVLNISMYDRQELLAAQEDPEKYRGLIVRVWGFNARFVELDRELQNHIINRIS